MMTDTLNKVRELLYCGLDDLSKSNTLDRTSIELIGEIVDALKDMDEIESHSYDGGDGYSNGGNMMRGNSYGYYGGGNSYGRGVMGNYREPNYNNRYSMEDGREYMIRQLEDLMHKAQNESDKRAIENLVNQFKR